jgi:hypothetical protein
MKELMSILALILVPQLSFATSEVVAKPVIHDFNGEYVFEGGLEPIGRITVDVIDLRMSDAQPRLEKLRSEGSACQHVTSVAVRCTKMNPGATVPADSLDRIAERSKDLSITFGQRTGAPVLISKAEALTEWQIQQRGETPLGRFDKYRYLELQGLVKIVFPNPQGNLELNTLDGRLLRKFESVTVHESRWRWHQDLAHVILTERR